MKRIKRRSKIQLFLVAMVISLAACGQRGNLYLPEPEQEPVKTSETETNETTAKETEDDKTGDDHEKPPGPDTE